MWLLVGMVKRENGGRGGRFVKAANVSLIGGKIFR